MPQLVSSRKARCVSRWQNFFHACSGSRVRVRVSFRVWVRVKVRVRVSRLGLRLGTFRTGTSVMDILDRNVEKNFAFRWTCLIHRAHDESFVAYRDHIHFLIRKSMANCKGSQILIFALTKTRWTPMELWTSFMRYLSQVQAVLINALAKIPAPNAESRFQCGRWGYGLNQFTPSLSILYNDPAGLLVESY